MPSAPGNGDGPIHQIFRVRVPFGLIGIEQRFFRYAIQHQRQLPGEINDVTHPRIHALTEKRRRLVGGISGEEYAIGSPGFRRGGMKLINDCAADIVGFSRCPAIEQFPDTFGTLHLLSSLAGQQLELPASIRIFCANKGGEPIGIAYLHGLKG